MREVALAVIAVIARVGVGVGVVEETVEKIVDVVESRTRDEQLCRTMTTMTSSSREGHTKSLLS